MTTKTTARDGAAAGPSTLTAWSEDPFTARARAVWTGGDFHQIARSYTTGAAEFVGRLGIQPGELVLDVACGTGNLAIPAARAGGVVTGIDIAANLIATAWQEAREARVEISFDVGDAEALPYLDDQFATTISMFGTMFAYRPERVVSELIRVTRPAGRIALANWTPEGFVGEMLRAHVAVVPPPAGVPSSLLWGVEDTVRERFGDTISSLTCTRRKIELSFPFGPAAVAELFASYYGPTVATLKAADPAGASRLRSELIRLFTEHNIRTGSRTTVVGEYLEVWATVA